MNDNNMNQNGMGVNNGTPDANGVVQSNVVVQPQVQTPQAGVTPPQPMPAQPMQPMQQPVMGGQMPAQPPQKKSNAFLIIIIILVVVIVGLLLVVVLGKKDDNGSGTGTGTNVNDKKDKEKDKDKDKDNPNGGNTVANGDTYELEGYIFSFPSKYEVEKGTNDIEIYDPTNKYIVAFFVDPYTYDEELGEVSYFENDILSATNTSIISSKEQTIAGRKWYIIESKGSDGVYYTEAFTKLDTYNSIVVVTYSGTSNITNIYKEISDIVDNVKSEYDSFSHNDGEKDHTKVKHNDNVKFEE